MNKSNCSRCSKEFEKAAEDKAVICQMCDGDMKSDVLVFQVFKWICFSIAFAAITFFIPVLAAKETSPGYYAMPGKNRSMPISKAGLDGWIIAIPVLTASFGLAGLYFGKKEDEKKSFYQNYQADNLPVE